MDNIQWKLKLIDRQLTWRNNFNKHIIDTSPLLFAAVGLIIGILVQNIRPLPIIFWLISTGLFATVSILLFVTQYENPRPVTIAYTLVFCFVCLGGIRLFVFNQANTNDVRTLVNDEKKLTTIRGLIVTEPYVKENRQWEFARFCHSDPSSSFYLDVSQIKAGSEWTSSAGTIRVQVNEPVIDLKAGDYVQLHCWLDKFKPTSNPGQFDLKRYLARKNSYISATVKSRDAIELVQNMDTSFLNKLRVKLRKAAGKSLMADLSGEETNSGLLQALLLGVRGNISSDTYTAFRKTGLLHFISLSGMHLGILMGIIWWLCKTVGLLKRGRAAVCAIAIIIFLLIVPPRPPTVRAAVICWVFCASFFFRRKPNSLNSLSIAAVILLLIRPTVLFEAGWQLSFASVLGILLFTSHIHFFLYEKITARQWLKGHKLTKPFFKIAARPGPLLLQLFAVGLAAWLGGAGILLYHFYTISPLTSLWTVIAFPFVAVILTIGYLKILLSFILPTASAILAVIVSALSGMLIWLVKLIADLNISEILIGKVPGFIIVCYYVLILFSAFIYFRRPLIKKLLCTAMLLSIIIFLGVTKWQRTHRDSLTVTVLDVGHGQAILAQMPGKENILFDAGSFYKSDIGRKIIVPFLRYSGISKIDSIVISHNDTDHINGIPEIVKASEVDSVYANDAFFSGMDKWDTASFLRESLAQKGINVQQLGKNLNINSDAKIKIFWPNEDVEQNRSLSDNDKSLVILIEFADRKVLLCSDIENFAQKALMQLYPNLKADVVVVPHHGSATTLEDNFLENLDAKLLICSCNKTQYKRLANTNFAQQSNTYFTSRDEALVIRIDKDRTIELIKHHQPKVFQVRKLQ